MSLMTSAQTNKPHGCLRKAILRGQFCICSVQIAFGISVWLRIYGFIYGSGWKIDSLFQFFIVMYYKSTNPRNERIVRSRRNFAGEVSNCVQILSIQRFDYFLTKIWKTANIWPRTILRLGYLEYRSLDWGSSVGSGWVTQHQARGFQKTKVFRIKKKSICNS